MAKKSPNRTVHCYLCDHVFEIPRDAMTTSCPACFKRVQIEDIVVKHAQGNTILGTCGRLIVHARASIVAKRIRAIEGVEVAGTIESAVETNTSVTIRASARWKGDCRAPVLYLEPGAAILGGFFEIGALAGRKTATEKKRKAEAAPPEVEVEAEPKPTERRIITSKTTTTRKRSVG